MRYKNSKEKFWEPYLIGPFLIKHGHLEQQNAIIAALITQAKPLIQEVINSLQDAGYHQQAEELKSLGFPCVSGVQINTGSQLPCLEAPTFSMQQPPRRDATIASTAHISHSKRNHLVNTRKERRKKAEADKETLPVSQTQKSLSPVKQKFFRLTFKDTLNQSETWEKGRNARNSLTQHIDHQEIKRNPLIAAWISTPEIMRRTLLYI